MTDSLRCFHFVACNFGVSSAAQPAPTVRDWNLIRGTKEEQVQETLGSRGRTEVNAS